MNYLDLEKELQKLANPAKVKILQRFFKTGKGEYGEGDVFLGVMVPEMRIVVKKYLGLALKDLQKLLDSKIHEHRSAALAILVAKYQLAKPSFVPRRAQDFGRAQKKIIDFYLKNSKKINNWDLVDISAPNILGDWFLNKDKSILDKLAKSKNLWERRIAMMSTFGFIKKNYFRDTLKIAEILLNDKHDLIHKAVGWMLREVGKRDLATEEKFLKKHYQKMPRVMLRYSIEKFSKGDKRFYLDSP